MIETTSRGSFDHDKKLGLLHETRCFVEAWANFAIQRQLLTMVESRTFGKTSPRNLTAAAASAIQSQSLQNILLVPMIAQMLFAHQTLESPSPPKGVNIDTKLNSECK